MGAPKLKESGKRILGQNILSGCKLRQKQMQYILDNLSEPDFSLIECPKQIADEFNMDDREVLNGAGITCVFLIFKVLETVNIIHLLLHLMVQLQIS